MVSHDNGIVPCATIWVKNSRTAVGRSSPFASTIFLASLVRSAGTRTWKVVDRIGYNCSRFDYRPQYLIEAARCLCEDELQKAPMLGRDTQRVQMLADQVRADMFPIQPVE